MGDLNGTTLFLYLIGSISIFLIAISADFFIEKIVPYHMYSPKSFYGRNKYTFIHISATFCHSNYGGDFYAKLNSIRTVVGSSSLLAEYNYYKRASGHCILVFIYHGICICTHTGCYFLI